MLKVPVFCQFPTSASILLLVLLGACGSTITDPLDFSSTQVAVDQVLGFADVIDVSPPTTVDQLPTGSASYSGVIGIASENTDYEVPSEVVADPLFAVGRMTVDADFDTGMVTGVGDHFIDGNDNQIGGQLLLDATTSPQNGDATDFLGTISGELTQASGDVYTYDIGVDGGFGGATGNVVAGSGDANFDLTTDGVTETIPFTIGFIAQR